MLIKTDVILVFAVIFAVILTVIGVFTIINFGDVEYVKFEKPPADIRYYYPTKYADESYLITDWVYYRNGSIAGFFVNIKELTFFVNWDNVSYYYNSDDRISIYRSD
jgi:hypothetical protein